MSNVQLVPENTVADFSKCRFYIIGENGQVEPFLGKDSSPGINDRFDVRLTIKGLMVKELPNKILGYQKVKPMQVGELEIEMPGIGMRKAIRNRAKELNIYLIDMQFFVVAQFGKTMLQFRFVIPCKEHQHYMEAGFVSNATELNKNDKWHLTPIILPLKEAEIGNFLPLEGFNQVLAVDKSLPSSNPVEITIAAETAQFQGALLDLQKKMQWLASDVITDAKKSSIGPGGVAKPQANPNAAAVQPVVTKDITKELTKKATMVPKEIAMVQPLEVMQKVSEIVAKEMQDMAKGIALLPSSKPPKPSPLSGLVPLPIPEFVYFDEAAELTPEHQAALEKVALAKVASAKEAAAKSIPVKPTTTKRVFDID